MKSIVFMISAILIGIVMAGCQGVPFDQTIGEGAQDDTRSTENPQTISAVVSILPQKAFVEAVGTDRVTVRSMIPVGGSPATYDPRPSDLATVEQADLYFRIGHIPFEQTHLQTLARLNPEMEIIDTSASVELRYFGSDDHHGEDHDEQESVVTDDHHDQVEESDAQTDHDDGAEENGHDGDDHDEDDHDHTGVDPHIWLSPDLVKEQVNSIAQALAEYDPEYSEHYYKNAESYVEKISDLDRELSETLETLNSQTFLVFHPAWGYFAEAYGLEQVAIEEDGKEPTAEHLQGIIDHAREEEIEVIFVQSQFNTAIAESIAEEIDGVVVQIDPLAENYLENMRSIAETIAQHLG